MLFNKDSIQTGMHIIRMHANCCKCFWWPSVSAIQAALGTLCLIRNTTENKHQHRFSSSHLSFDLGKHFLTALGG